jgi:TonB-dependent starch-binding outer membrane protein SusC
MYGNVDNSIGANKLGFVKDCYKIYDVDGSGNIQAITDPDALNKLNANAKYALPYYERGLVLSNWLEDGSYLRLNTLTIGYSLPQNILKKVKLHSLRVYATGTNLFVLTKYSGLDPEVNTNGSYGGFPTLGLDYYTYPRSRTFTLGLKLSL